MELNIQQFKKVLEAGTRKSRGVCLYALSLPGPFCIFGRVVMPKIVCIHDRERKAAKLLGMSLGDYLKRKAFLLAQARGLSLCQK